MGDLTTYHWLLICIAVGLPIYLLRRRAEAQRATGTKPNSDPEPSPKFSQPSARSPQTSSSFVAQSEPYEPAPPPPPSPKPARIDTDGAVEDMRLARSYIDDWYESKQTGIPELAFAARYVEQARQKDPDARLVVPSKKKDEEPNIYTQNDLAGELLYVEAMSMYEPTASPDTLLRVARILKRAIAFQPYSITYRSKLADVYLNRYDRKSALAVAHDAVQQNPRNLDARKLVDRIEAAPVLEPPTFFERNPDAMAPIGIVMVVAGIGLALYTFTSKSNDSVSLILWVLFLGGGYVWYRGRQKEKAALFDKAMADQQRKRMKN